MWLFFGASEVCPVVAGFGAIALLAYYIQDENAKHDLDLAFRHGNEAEVES